MTRLCLSAKGLRAKRAYRCFISLFCSMIFIREVNSNEIQCFDKSANSSLISRWRLNGIKYLGIKLPSVYGRGLVHRLT